MFIYEKKVIYFQKMQIRGNFIFNLKIFSLFHNYTFCINLPMKDFFDKRQAIKAKIKEKIREQQERKTQQQYEEQFDDEDYQDYSDYQQHHQVDVHEQAQINYQRSMSQLKQYLDRFQNNGDSQYTHKLLFDFFKAQAIFQNLQEDSTNQQIYQKFIKPDIKNPLTNANESNTQFEPIEHPTLITPNKQIDKKMTLKDKLQSGKFLSYGHIPQNDQIEQYRSISSEDEILQQDCLQELIMKTKRGKQYQRPRHGKRKQRQDDRKKSRSSSSSSINRKISYSNSNRRPLQFSQGEDSSNEAHYDSQQSQTQRSQSSDQEYSDDSHEQHDYQGVTEDFKHLDMYEEMEEFGMQQDLDYILNSAINSGKQKKINGVQQYHFMKKAQKDKYFKKMTKQFQNDLRRVKQQKKQKVKQSRNQKRSQQRFVSFCDAIYYKNFNIQAKPNDVKIADENQQVLVKAIWQYDE